MPKWKRPAVPGFLRAMEIRSEGLKRGINVSVEGLKRMVRLGRIKADSKDSHPSHPSFLFKTERLEELLRTAPRARKSNQPGFFSLQQFQQAARERGITDLSITGLERQIQLGKIQPDDWISPSTKRGPLFKKERLAGMLASAPREKARIPPGFTTSYAVLAQAQKINPSAYLSQLQQFLKKTKTDSRFSHHWKRAITERHGKQKRTVFPKEIGDAFIQLVKGRQLAGLFAGERKQKPVKPSIPKAVPSPAIRSRRRVPNAQALYAEMGKPPSDFEVASHNMRVLLPGSGAEMMEGQLARYLKLSPQQMERLIRRGLLVATEKGTIRLDSVKKLFRPYL